MRLENDIVTNSLSQVPFCHIPQKNIIVHGSNDKKSSLKHTIKKYRSFSEASDVAENSCKSFLSFLHLNNFQLFHVLFKFCLFAFLFSSLMVQRVYSIQVDDSKSAPGEGPTQRSILSASGLMTTPAAGVETLYDVLQYAASTFKQRRAFGYRILEDTFQKEKQVTDSSGKTHTKTWTYFQLSKYHYYTYQEAADITKHLGAGLYKMGLKQGDKLHLFASTR